MIRMIYYYQVTYFIPGLPISDRKKTMQKAVCLIYKQYIQLLNHSCTTRAGNEGGRITRHRNTACGCAEDFEVKIIKKRFVCFLLFSFFL